MSSPKTGKAKKVNYEAMAEFRYALRSFLSFSEHAAREAGLEAQQYQALLALKGLPADQKATVGTLADRLLIKHHSAVELAIRLEANRLVRRVRSRSDRRQVFIELAPRGEKMLRQLALTHRAELVSQAPMLIRSLEEIAGRSSNGHPRRVSPRNRSRSRRGVGKN